MQKILLLILAVTLSGCSAKPPYYGVFLSEGPDYREMYEFEDPPFRAEKSQIPLTENVSPSIIVWLPNIDLELLVLTRYDVSESISFRAKPIGDDLLQISPATPLRPGTHCLVQGNPLAVFLRTWCFAVSEFSIGSVKGPLREITLVAHDIYWEPAILEARAGEEIEVTVHNVGALDHSFVISNLGIDIFVAPGESITVPRFSLTETAKIPFVCGIAGHAEAGMVGELIITP